MSFSHILKLKKEIEEAFLLMTSRDTVYGYREKLCSKLKSGDENDDDEDRHNLIDFHIMGGGITPKSQPLDLFLIGKIMKDMLGFV